MITINANTRIEELLSNHPAAIDAIISINPKFRKLKNPVLRKLMAGRTSIERASRIGGCSVDDFFKKLEPLGFKVEQVPDCIAKDLHPGTDLEETVEDSTDWEGAMTRFEGKMNVIDVRSLEMPGPMLKILEEVSTLPGDKALFVYHKRIPVFLLPELQEKNFDYRIKTIGPEEVHLLIFKL